VEVSTNCVNNTFSAAVDANTELNAIPHVRCEMKSTDGEMTRNLEQGFTDRNRPKTSVGLRDRNQATASHITTYV
jgi:hypothetical protein